MISATLAWFVAGICITAFVTLWFSVCFKELSAKRNSLEAISEQVQLHRTLYMQERGNENNSAARNILDNKLIVYKEVAKEYDALLKKPRNYITAYIMGFRNSDSSKDK
jgi:hypothetical protein